MGWRRTDGQASAELLAIVPLALIAFLALAQAVLAGWALLSAGEAARAAARAVHVGSPPAPAARRALPALLLPGDVRERDGSITVRLRAPGVIPGVGGIGVAASAALDPAAGASGAN